MIPHPPNTAQQRREDHERRENARSIEAIPTDQLPDQEARAELIRRALVGADVYAYTPIGSQHGGIWVHQSPAGVESASSRTSGRDCGTLATSPTGTSWSWSQRGGPRIPLRHDRWYMLRPFL